MVWSLCPLAVTTVSSLVLAEVVAVWAVCHLAVAAAAACLSVGRGAHFWLSPRCETPRWASWHLRGWGWCGQFAGSRTPRRLRAGRCGRPCGLFFLPIGEGYGGSFGVGSGCSGMDGLPVGGHRGSYVFAGVRGGAVWVVRPLPVVVLFALLLAAVAAVWALRQLAVAAAAACSLAWAAALLRLFARRRLRQRRRWC